MPVLDVIEGRRLWDVEAADCLAWLQTLPDGCASLCMFSPPYADARLYGEVDFRLTGEDWVGWMRPICVEAARVASLVVVVVDGKTEGRRYDMTPFLLAADLHRAGLSFRHPCCYFRFSIPGSGGDEWLRNDWEPILCFQRQAGPLPWSDNTAAGHPPKWASGGEMSNRMGDGSRVNQWGGHETSGSHKTRTGKQAGGRPSHAPSGYRGGDMVEREGYSAPVIANPGNVVAAHYDAEKVRQLLTRFAGREIDQGDVIRCLVGGNQMGNNLSHENEAPYPERLCDLFIRSFSPPGGLVIDPFSGSGTTGAVAVRHGRRFIGCDLRESMRDLSRRRIAAETPTLFPEA